MHKRILILAIAVLFLLSSWRWVDQPGFDPGVDEPIQVVDSAAEYLILSISGLEPSLQDVVMLDGRTYTHISSGGGISGEVGAPDVPIFTAWILVPNGTEPSMVVRESLNQVVDIEHTLSPVQYDYIDLEGAPIYDFVIDEEAYATPGGYPSNFGELGETQLMRGQEMALVKLYPVKYDHAGEQLQIYDLEVEISFDGELRSIPPQLVDETFDDMYRDLAINAEQVLSAEYEAAPSDEAHFGDYGWDYLIITDPLFETAANTLAAWKTQSGYKTLVTKVPKNLKPEDLKKALINAYRTWDIKPKFVLLIGDAENIPPFYKTWHDFNSTALHGLLDSQGYVGTDLYYSTLESKDPSQPDLDLIPEVLLGRLSVEAAYQAEDRVAAIINYEKDPPKGASFYNTALLAAQFQDGGTAEVYNPNTGTTSYMPLATNGIEDKRFTQTTEDVSIFLESTAVGKTNLKRLYYGGFDRAKSSEYPKKWNNSNDLFKDWTNFDGPRKNTVVGGNIPTSLQYPGFPWNADSSQISSAINAGAFLVTHRDHGGRTGWSNPSFNMLHVFTLLNQDKLPVVWSMNCQTGWFDNETDFSKKAGITDLTTNSQESFSETWERPLGSAISNDDYGAVGVLAATRVTYGSINERLFEGLVDAIWPKYFEPNPKDKPIYGMGAVIAQAKTYMSSKTVGGTKDTIQNEAYHWFGDPSMKIRTEPPLQMAVFKDQDPWTWALYARDLKVYVKDDGTNPIKDAKVTLKKTGSSGGDRPAFGGQPLEHWIAMTDEEGVATFHELKTNHTGDYEVVVTAPNYLPDESTLTVAPGSAGGIALDSEVYPCNTTVRIKVADIDLEAEESIEVGLSTLPGDDQEVVTLYPGLEPGLFEGGIEAGCARVNPHNGSLEVSHEDIITAEYADADNGMEGVSYRANVEDAAVVDAQAPEFGGLSSVEVEGCYVRLTWEAAQDPHGLVNYNLYRGESPGGPYSALIARTWTLSWTDDLCPLGGTYYYNVSAEDALGNIAENSVEGTATIYGIVLPLIYR